jgi:hypothetical protein
MLNMLACARPYLSFSFNYDLATEDDQADLPGALLVLGAQPSAQSRISALLQHSFIFPSQKQPQKKFIIRKF